MLLPVAEITELEIRELSMQVRRIAEGVYVCDENVIKVARPTIAELKKLALDTPKQRARLCAHRSNGDTLHEMLIVLNRATYVRPHRHHGKSESFHVIEGELTVLLFTDAGQIRETIRMGPYDSGLQFYYRLAEPAFHTVLVHSELAVIHETTNGPFEPAETDHAAWAPAEGDVEGIQRYRSQLLQSLRDGN